MAADDTTFPIPDRAHSDPDRIRVICIGAGFSGLCLAYKMQEKLTNYELVVYEKNASVGGYPGCACDIPSAVYSYSFAPNPNWSSFYAYASEIEQYIVDFADKHALGQYVRLNARVVSATWVEARGEYDVEVETPDGVVRDHCHVLVSGAGVLNKWKWPAIPGLRDFAGPLLHSAHWDDSVDYRGKRVAVLGTGSSAIQVRVHDATLGDKRDLELREKEGPLSEKIIPSLQPAVASLTAFMRSPTWISPAVATDVLDGLETTTSTGPTGPTGPTVATVATAVDRHQYSAQQIKTFQDDPAYYLQFRKTIESQLNAATDVFTAGSAMNEDARKAMAAEMARRIGPGNDDLKARLIPQRQPGCRRLTPGDGYLEALVQPNVRRVFGEIDRVTERGLWTADGVFHEVDVLVCATGFDVAFVPSFALTGRGGRRMQDEWAAEPVCYLGLAAPKFPNYWISLGPRGPWGNGPLLPAIETLADYFVQVVAKMQAEQIKAVEVQQAPTVQFNAFVDEWMKRSVWKAACRSWYKMGTVDGKAWLWPGGTLSYLKTIKQPRYEDFSIEYKQQNIWAFLGNGKTLSEMPQSGSDLAPYIRLHDTPWTVL